MIKRKFFFLCLACCFAAPAFAVDNEIDPATTSPAAKMVATPDNCVPADKSVHDVTLTFAYPDSDDSTGILMMLRMLGKSIDRCATPQMVEFTARSTDDAYKFKHWLQAESKSNVFFRANIDPDAKDLVVKMRAATREEQDRLGTK